MRTRLECIYFIGKQSKALRLKGAIYLTSGDVQEQRFTVECAIQSQLDLYKMIECDMTE